MGLRRIPVGYSCGSCVVKGMCLGVSLRYAQLVTGGRSEQLGKRHGEDNYRAMDKRRDIAYNGSARGADARRPRTETGESRERKG